MPDILPGQNNIQVIQSVGPLSTAALNKLDGALIVVPEKIPALAWRQIPGGTSLKTAAGRASKDQPVRTRLTNKRATELHLKRLPSNDLETSFRLLTWAAKALAGALQSEPRNLGVIVVGFEPATIRRVIQALVLAAGATAAPLPTFRSKKSKHRKLSKLRIFGLDRRVDIDRAQAESRGINLARWLTALPPNQLNTRGFRDALAALAKTHGWKFQFLNLAKLEKLGAGAFLAVAQGNAERDAGIVQLSYRPKAGTKRPKLALVGKGIIFDTGGNNLKPFKSMLDMHQDMGGSAIALGTLQALTEIEFPCPVDCWLAITENRIGAKAYKSRDIVTAVNGTTIEIIHTDAEGRMVLADTLALAGEKKPALIIDYATLTGACHYALTDRYSGIFSNRAELNPIMIETGTDSGERVWPFPMDADFDDEIKSDVADVLQCSISGEADQILAARFLQKFVPTDTPWIHIDLSAVVRKEGLAQVPSGPTGFGIRYTLNLLYEHAHQAETALGRELPTGTDS